MARLGGGTTIDTTSTSNELYYAGEAFRLAYDVGTGEGSKRVGTDFLGNVINARAIAVEVTGNNLTTAAPLGLCTIDSVDTHTTKANCTGTWKQGFYPDSTEGVGVGANGNINLTEGLNDISVRDGLCTNSKGAIASFNDANGNPVYYTSMNTCVAKGDCTPNASGTAVKDSTQDSCDTATNTFFAYVWDKNLRKEKGKFHIYIPKDILKKVGFTEAPQPGSPLYIAYSVTYSESSGNLLNTLAAPGTAGDEETRVIETDIIGFKWTPMFNITD